MDDQIEAVWRIFHPPSSTTLAWGARTPQFIGGPISSAQTLIDLCERYGKIYDCYFSPNPISKVFTFRPSADHVSHVRFITLDLDPVTASPDLDYAERSVIEHAENLLGFELHPDRVDSGRGRQLWLRFEPTPVTTQEEKSRWRSAVGAFLHRLDKDLGVARGVRLDTACCDLPRLVRLPGTINSKTGRTARFIKVGALHSNLHETVLRDFWVPRAHTSLADSASGDWRLSFHHLSHRAKLFLLYGCAEPGRHSGAFAAAASMKDMGVGYEATEIAVLLGADKCSPSLSEYEAKRCIRNAFAKEELGGA